MSQIINEATRITQNSRTLIDLIFVSCPDIVNSSGVTPQFCSDHCSVSVSIKSTKQTKKAYSRFVYNYADIDVDTFRHNTAQVDWDFI